MACARASPGPTPYPDDRGAKWALRHALTFRTTPPGRPRQHGHASGPEPWRAFASALAPENFPGGQPPPSSSWAIPFRRLAGDSPASLEARTGNRSAARVDSKGSFRSRLEGRNSKFHGGRDLVGIALEATTPALPSA